MKIISPISTDILKIWNEQEYVEKIEYKLIRYHHYIEIKEGILLYNVLTYELVLITRDELNHLYDGTLKEYNRLLYRFFVIHWFMIPKEYDEKTLSYIIKSSYRKSNLFNKNVNLYTILTTTDCNARCYYCYELGSRRITMTEQVAKDVAKYIENRSSKDARVHLGWFGGEPLFNEKVINIICEHLKEKGFRYFSTMISNSYLFDEEIINKAVNIWNLERVQITLDGMETTYNKTKAYIYSTDNPFQKVIQNIKLLLDAGIFVNIRFNLSEKNASELYQVVDYLYEKFKNHSKLHIHISPLFENIENNLLIRTDKEREYIYDEIFKLEDYVESKNMLGVATLRNPGVCTIYCMADNPDACIISPTGKLGLCEHHIDDDFYGDIYGHRLDRDYSIVETWKERGDEFPECEKCIYYPRCNRLKRCETDPSNPKCTHPVRKDYIRKMERIIMKTFDKYKTSNLDVITDYVERHPNDEEFLKKLKESGRRYISHVDDVIQKGE